MMSEWTEQLREGNRNNTARQNWTDQLKHQLNKADSDKRNADFPPELAVAALQTAELRQNLHVVLSALYDAIREECAVGQQGISDLETLRKAADASIETLRACVCALVDGCRRSARPLFLLRNALVCCGQQPGFELPMDDRKPIGMIPLDMAEVIQEALIAPGQPSEANLTELFCVTNDTENSGDKGWFSRSALVLDVSRGAMYLRESSGAFDPHSIRPMARSATYSPVPFDRLRSIIDTAKKNIKDTQAERFSGMNADNWREVLQAVQAPLPDATTEAAKEPMRLRDDVPWAAKDIAEMRMRCESALSYLAERIGYDCPESVRAAEMIDWLTELLLMMDDDEKLKCCIHSLYDQARHHYGSIVTAALVLSDCGFQLPCAQEEYTREAPELRWRGLPWSGSAARGVYRELLQPLRERWKDTKRLFTVSSSDDAMLDGRTSSYERNVLIDMRTGVLYMQDESRMSDMGNTFAGAFSEDSAAFAYNELEDVVKLAMKLTGKQDAARFAAMTAENWRAFVPGDE